MATMREKLEGRKNFMSSAVCYDASGVRICVCVGGLAEGVLCTTSFYTGNSGENFQLHCDITMDGVKA